MERCEDRAAPRCRRNLGEGGEGSRAALWRNGSPGQKLVVVRALAWRRQAGASSRCSIRWHTQACSGQQEWWQGNDPQMLYGPKHPADALPDPSYVKHFYDRTRDLIDQHDPDILYFDNSMFPLGWAGMNIAAYFTIAASSIAEANWMSSPTSRTCRLTCQRCCPRLRARPHQRNHALRLAVGNLPRKLALRSSALYDQPGEFGGYLHPRDVIHWLVDTVSKNGTFVLSVPGKPDGTIDSKEIAVLDKITAWMSVNSEAIYETRPWKIFGEGPTKVSAGAFNGTSVANLGAKDVRFTRTKRQPRDLCHPPWTSQRGNHHQALGLSSTNSPRKNREGRGTREPAGSTVEAGTERPDNQSSRIAFGSSRVWSDDESLSRLIKHGIGARRLHRTPLDRISLRCQS
jgi:hypothetical protein